MATYPLMFSLALAVACSDTQTSQPNASSPETMAQSNTNDRTQGTSDARMAAAGSDARSGSTSAVAGMAGAQSGMPARSSAAPGTGTTAGAGGTGTSRGAPSEAGGGATTAGIAGAIAGSAGIAAGSGGAAGTIPAAAECDAADKMPEPMSVSFKYLGGYDSLSMEPTTGPLKPVIEVHPGFAEWTVYRPEPLAPENTHEIMIWANGGCLLNSTIQGHFLLELASWGFVVVADGSPQDNNSGADPAAGGIRPGPDGAPMVMAMDWITAENERPCSPFYHKLDVSRIGTGGQSCGGMMTMLSAADERVTTAMVFNSGLTGNNQLFTSYHAPMLFLDGGASDFLSGSASANVNAINSVPIFYGSLQVGHGGTWEDSNGGEMGRVALGWLKWNLQGDAAFEPMFAGSDCELCTPPSDWTVRKKMMD